MLFAFEPRSRVCTGIWHHIDTITLPFIQLVEAFVPTPVRIGLHSEPIYFLISPIAGELAAISPHVRAKAFDQAVLVGSSIALVIGPLLDAIAISSIISIIAVKCRSVWIPLRAYTVHDSFLEFALELKIVHVGTQAFAVVEIIGPLAFVFLAPDLGELAPTVCPA